MNQGLTVRERVFVEKYLEYKDTVKAVLSAYDIQGRNKNRIASAMGCQILKRERVQVYLGRFIPDDLLIDLLKRGMDATELVRRKNGTIVVPDWTTRIKSLEIALKLKGYLNPKEQPHQNRTGKITVKFNKAKLKMR